MEKTQTTDPASDHTSAVDTGGPHDRASLGKWVRLLVVTVTTLLLIILGGTLIRLLMEIHHTVLLFALGALIAYALDPIVERLRHSRIATSGKIRRAPSRSATVGMLFFVLTVFLVLGTAYLAEQIAAQVAVYERDSPKYVASAQALGAKADKLLAAHHVHFSIMAAVKNPPPQLTAALSRFGSQVVPELTHIFASVGESAIVLLISLYLLLYGSEMKLKMNAILPKNLLPHAELWETDVNRILGGFVRGQLIIALLMGALAGVACFAVGIHLWLIIGLLVVVAALIPVFGPYIGAIPAIVAALVGPTRFHSHVVAAVVILVLFILINEVGSKVFYPRLVGAALGLHEVLVLFVLFAGLEIDGIVGVLFAAPITALAIVTGVHLYRFWQELPDTLLANKGEKLERATEAAREVAG